VAVNKEREGERDEEGERAGDATAHLSARAQLELIQGRDGAGRRAQTVGIHLEQRVARQLGRRGGGDAAGDGVRVGARSVAAGPIRKTGDKRGRSGGEV